ncbi:PR domain zinc finger protein 5 [Microdochium nivale]|nr:PR domain zinc finger protein 5 [Microdochium nivale]
MDTYASQNSTPDEDRTIASQAALCLRRFKSCLDRAAIIHARELSAVEDQLARFSLWSGNIRVFGSSRQSLDHRLREAPEVLDVVLAMLGALSQRLESYSSLLVDFKPYTDTSNFASIDYNLRKAHDDISGQVTLLHKLSNTIRRASKQTGNDKAAEYFVIRGDDGDDVESWLFDVFLSYLQDKFVDATEEICRRLAQSMLLRRKRILYRRTRYGHAPIEVDVVPEEPTLEVPLPILSETPDARLGSVEHPAGKHVAPRSMAPSATTLSAKNFKRATAPSIVSASRTIPLNRHDALQFPPAPLWPVQSKFIQIMTSNLSTESLSEAQKRQEHEKITVLSGKPNLAVPEWREAASAVGEITCPYCFYALPAIDVMCERKWMMHVKGDLDPYVCLYENCDSPHELYAHSRDWIKHMKGHTLRWRCTSKLHTAHTSTTQQEYIEHLRNTHSTRLSDNQLRVVADRRAVFLGPVFASCPLCGATAAQSGDSSSIEEHVASHLRLVALKSLPVCFDDSTDGAPDHQSALNSTENTRTTIREDRDGSFASKLFGDIADMNPRRVMCNVCPFVTSSTANLRRHTARIHRDRSLSLVCFFPGCDRTFSRRDNLQKHMNMHNFPVSEAEAGDGGKPSKLPS